MIIIETKTRIEAPDSAVSTLLRTVGRGFEDSVVGSIESSLQGVPRIGSEWKEQGGIYAGVMRGHDGKPDYHLILPAAAEIAEVAYGGRGQDETAAACEWDGWNNTIALAQSKHSHPAAEWARQQVAQCPRPLYHEQPARHTDLYLPSRRELRLAWTNVPELFTEGWYWSSTQYSPGNAWVQGFASGSQYDGDKVISYRARAVRRLIIQ
jgi:hypothetical protein